MEHFKQHEHTHAHTQAPDIPGQYELRYYPAWLSGSYSGYRHEIYWAAKQFTVSGNQNIIATLYRIEVLIFD